MYVCLNVIQTVKNVIWSRRRLQFVLVAGILIFLVYLVSKFVNVGSARRHERQHEEFVKVIEETKKNREEFMRKHLASGHLQSVVSW